MKKVFFGLLTMFFTLVCFAVPNEKVLHSFSLAFPKADSVNWYESENGYEVHFKTADMQCRLWYDKEGNVLKAYRYYFQNMLPPMILSSVRKKYTDKTIYGVTEITNQDGMTYYLVLEDSKYWYHITSDAIGSLSLSKKLKKAD